MLSPLQQTVDLIQRSKKILIALPENLNADNIGSALALNSALKKLDKKSEIISLEPLPEKLKFLPEWEIIKNKISPWRDFIISINTSQNKISRLRYETADHLLKIFLTTPQKIEERDIRLEPGPYNYDLIIVLDAPDLESLGRLYEENTGLFFEKTVLNIDHQSANEHFGQVNLVETMAASCAEIIVNLIESLSPGSSDQSMAFNLLAGLVFKTRSFQNISTTPQAFNLASQLISQGAELEKIVQHLYKTKPLNCLKLWGRLLSRAELDQEKNVLWLLVEENDFASSKTSSRDLFFILDEAADCFPQIKTTFILWPGQENFIEILGQAKQIEFLQKLNLELGGTIKGNRLLAKLGQTDLTTAKNFLRELLNFLS